jgi:hypothetical protein
MFTDADAFWGVGDEIELQLAVHNAELHPVRAPAGAPSAAYDGAS